MCHKEKITLCLVFPCVFFVEHLNILLFGLAQRLHTALSAVDMSFCTSHGEKLKNVENRVPSCHHHQPAKLVMVQKEGPNKVLLPLPVPFSTNTCLTNGVRTSCFLTSLAEVKSWCRAVGPGALVVNKLSVCFHRQMICVQGHKLVSEDQPSGSSGTHCTVVGGETQKFGGTRPSSRESQGPVCAEPTRPEGVTQY